MSKAPSERLLISTCAGLYDQRLEETEIKLLYQAVQAANATKRLLALSNSETLPQPAPPPSSPPAAAAAPVVRLLPNTLLIQVPVMQSNSSVFLPHGQGPPESARISSSWPALGDSEAYPSPHPAPGFLLLQEDTPVMCYVPLCILQGGL